METKKQNSEERVLLSICIPTYKRPEIIRQLLNSIITQDVSQEYYEIRITDNSETDETEKVISEEFSDVKNLFYKKVSCKGFYNSVEALMYGEGRFLKLHNDYSLFTPGSLQRLVNRVKDEEQDHAQLFFSLGALKGISETKVFHDYNSFMNCISYQATWSSAFSIWKADFDSIVENGIVPDEMFPHTTFLHMISDKEEYVVDNYSYVKNVEPKKKGGYNLIDNFVHIYLSMVRNELVNPGRITEETYKKIEKGILKFCAGWYYTTIENPEKYMFKFDNAEEIVNAQCGKTGLSMYRKFLRRERRAFSFRKMKKRVKKVLYVGHREES